MIVNITYYDSWITSSIQESVLKTRLRYTHANIRSREKCNVRFNSKMQRARTLSSAG